MPFSYRPRALITDRVIVGCKNCGVELIHHDTVFRTKCQSNDESETIAFVFDFEILCHNCFSDVPFHELYDRVAPETLVVNWN